MVTQRDLALAYSPGVAYACEAIVADPNAASELTARGNLVAVITNGTAVLGLGDIGPLAGKPVMEGKGILFQKFAGIDVFDIEIDERDPGQAGRHHRQPRADLRRHQPRGHQGAGMLHRRAQVARAHEHPGVPRRPARHRDHRRRGRAQCAGSGRQGHRDVKLATSGAGAAGIACLDMLVALGMEPEQHPGRRPRWRAAHRPRQSRPRQAALRARHRQAHAGRHRRTAPTSSSACRPAAC